jgi:hypothetical protein
LLQDQLLAGVDSRLHSVELLLSLEVNLFDRIGHF